MQAAARDVQSLILALNNREEVGDAKSWQGIEVVLSETDSSDEEDSEGEMELEGGLLKLQKQKSNELGFTMLTLTKSSPP